MHPQGLLEQAMREKNHASASLKKELEEAHRETGQMEQRALAAESGCDCDQWKDKWRDQQAQLYATQTELEEEREKNRKLTAQVNRDFENPPVPSSLQPVRKKKIANSRD